MRTGDTIGALASPPGRSTRALVRLSGPGALEAIDRSSMSGGEGLASAGAGRGGVATEVRLRLGDRDRAAFLPALAVVFRAPASYTGEDVVELQIPGNPLVVERLLESLFRAGVRPAEPGEFTARAFLNGRLTIEQAEGVAQTIAARSEEELAAATRLLCGATGERYRAMAEETATLLALVEAGVDFTDQEDVVPIGGTELRTRLTAITDEIDRATAGGAASERPPEAAVVVLAGAPSAGKSTLFNALLGRRRTVTAAAPGTTRDAIAEPLDLSRDVAMGPIVSLVDIAGLDEALSRRSSADAGAQIAARTAIEAADVVVICDPDGAFELPVSPREGAVVLRVRTKADLPRARGPVVVGRTEGVTRPDAIAVCALDGWNMGALRRAIADAAESARSAGSIVVLPRHRRALAAARARIGEAIECFASDQSPRALQRPELIADSLRGALDDLGEIAGRIPPDDVIGRIFASFCVGK